MPTVGGGWALGQVVTYLPGPQKAGERPAGAGAGVAASFPGDCPGRGYWCFLCAFSSQERKGVQMGSLTLNSSLVCGASS